MLFVSCRQGAFECEPDLATYRGVSGELRDSENEPPSLHTADQPTGEVEEEDSNSETEGVCMEEQWTSVDMWNRGRVEYESSYFDYMALGSSSNIQRQTREEEDGEREGEGDKKTVGLFGTISSLFSSTFSHRTS